MSKAWLKDLEEKVQAAADQLRQSREQNAELKADNERLEQRAQELETQLAEQAEAPADDSAWTAERDEIRQRVETLADHLGQLLEDAS